MLNPPFTFAPWTPPGSRRFSSPRESSHSHSSISPTPHDLDSLPPFPGSTRQGSGARNTRNPWHSGETGALSFANGNRNPEVARRVAVLSTIDTNAPERRPILGLGIRNLALASPGAPNDLDSVWCAPSLTRPSQPATSGSPVSANEVLRLNATILRQQMQIDRLTAENNDLREQINLVQQSQFIAAHMQPLMTPEISPSPTDPDYAVFTPPPSATPTLPDSFMSMRSSGSWSRMVHDRAHGRYPLNSVLLDHVQQGYYENALATPQLIRPLVEIVIYSPYDFSTLKALTSALASRLALPRDSQILVNLIAAIKEFGRDLCFANHGNYLAQQYLERSQPEERLDFIESIKDDIVALARNRFGVHVISKAIGYTELQPAIADALFEHGVFETCCETSRRVWWEYLGKSRQAGNLEVFHRFANQLSGRWAELAVQCENGSITVQHIFEIFTSKTLTQPCFEEIMADISTVAGNRWGHYLIGKLLENDTFRLETSKTLLAARPPVAVTHHGVNFVKQALSNLDKDGGLSTYIDVICDDEDGTPGIVALALSAIGKSHLLASVFGCNLSPSEHQKIRQTLRKHMCSARLSQSGNDLLRQLCIIQAPKGGNRPNPPNNISKSDRVGN